MLAGRVSVESQVPLGLRGQSLPVKDGSVISNIVVNFAIGKFLFVAFVGHTFWSLGGLSYPQSSDKASGLSLSLREEVGHRVVRSRDTSTMTKPASDGGQSDRFRRAGALWSRGFGCLRPGECNAASTGCSDRCSRCHEIVWSHLLRDPTRSCCGRGEFGQELDILQFFAGCFIKISAEFASRRKIVADSRQTGDWRTLSRWSALRHGTGNAAELLWCLLAQSDQEATSLLVNLSS